MRRPRLSWLLLPALIAAALPAAAQDDPNTSRGFSADNLYQFGEVGTVDLFNGNLALVLPIGDEYPVNASLRYGLKLTYNSNVWDFSARRDPLGNEFTEARFAHQFNAGPGWKLSLGEFRTIPSNEVITSSSILTYVGADGASHRFYRNLHAGESVDGDYYYTRDNSYLRLHLGGGGKEATVESPNGTRHRFSRALDTDPFRLAWIRDRYDNELAVAYSADGLTWTLSDGHRSHQVHFFDTTSDGFAERLVDRVELAAFGGATATYDFVYDSGFTTRRHCEDTWHNPGDADYEAETPVLREVVLPDGSSWEMAEYGTTCAEGPGMLRRLVLPTLGQVEWSYGEYRYPARTGSPSGGRVNITSNYGVVRKRHLGRNGTCITSSQSGCEWTYTPDGSPDGGPMGDHRTTTVTLPTRSSGVQDKIVHHFNQVYQFQLPSFEGWPYGLPFRPGQASNGRHLSQEIFEGSTKVREIWVEYERDVMIQSHAPEQWYDRNRRVKSRQTVYHDDGQRYKREVHGDFDGLGHYRQTVLSSNVAGGSTRTVRTEHNSGNGSYTVNVANNSAGGGYQKWPVAAPWILGTYTEMSQSEGGSTAKQQYCFDAAKGVVTRTRTLVGASPGANDVLQVFERQASTGNVIRERTYGGDTGSPGSGSVCSATTGAEQYRREMSYENGTLSEAKWVTGSGGLVLYTHRSTNDADTGLPSVVTAANDLETTLTYDTSGRITGETPQTDHGARTSYTYERATLSKQADVLIRHHTNDGSVVLTKEEVRFDGFGRPLWNRRTEPNGEWSTVATSYDARGWKLAVSERMFGFPDKSTKYQDFDAFGRPREIVPPDGVVHAIDLSYAGDRVVTRSYTVCSASDGCLGTGTGPPAGDLTLSNDTVTGVESHEALGTIQAGPSYTVAASGDLTLTSATRVVFTDGFSVASGGRLAAGVDPGLGTGSTGETTYQVIERRDQHGRLYQVVEPSGTNDAMVTTTYSYDVGNRLRQASTTSGGVTQTRLFDYDHRGFLTSERHPEKGAGGNGFVTYSNYDPLGNPGRKVDGPFDLRYGYDRAGRLTDIDEWTGSATRPMKQLTYATFNNGSDRRGGQLWQAERWNYLPLGEGIEVRVVETYGFDGRAGAVSHRDTQTYVDGVPREGFTQNFSWRDLGNLNYLDYPECVHAWCGVASPRRVQFNFDPENRTYLSSIQDLTTQAYYATAITYHPNGVPATTNHANGVADHQALEASAMARPARLWTTGASANWDSGTFVYDGTGNISALGSHRYSYDGVSRLTRAQIGTAQNEGGSHLTRTYSYDAFGNLKQLGALDVPENPATNRLDFNPYDGAGNLLSWNGTGFEYDALGMVTQRSSQNYTAVFIYTADDERLWTFTPGAPSRWTIRDLDGKVLRDYRADGATWSVERDYVYANGRLVAATDGTTTYHYHPDHLGTPRLITNQNGNKLAYHAYYPYGEEATFWNQDSERMKFTGHERDFYEAGVGDDLDYQHARYLNFQIGKYLQVDPITGEVEKPQSWNRYAYVLNNPIALTDPKGLVVKAMTDKVLHDLCILIGKDCQNAISVGKDGTISVTASSKEIASSEILGLLKDLQDSKNVYGVWVGDQLPVAGGSVGLGNKKGEKGAANYSKTPDHRVKNSTKPASGFDAVIGVAINYETITTGLSGEQTHRPSALFHEMAESYERTDKAKQYADAHATAKIREQHLRNQDTSLKQYVSGAGPVRREIKP